MASPLSAAQATRILEEYLADRYAGTDIDPVPYADPMDYGDYWVQGYQSRAFVETDDIMTALAGNGPLVIPKDGRSPFTLSSARSTDVQMAAIIESGPPNPR